MVEREVAIERRAEEIDDFEGGTLCDLLAVCLAPVVEGGEVTEVTKAVDEKKLKGTDQFGSLVAWLNYLSPTDWETRS